MERPHREQAYYRDREADFALLHGIIGNHSPMLADLFKKVSTSKTATDNGPSSVAEPLHLMRMLVLSGKYLDIASPEEFDTRPQLFWDLCDLAAKEEDRTHAFLSVMILYRYMQKRQMLEDAFIKATGSPYDFIKRIHFCKHLAGQYCGREYMYRLNMRFTAHNKGLDNMVCLVCRSSVVRTALVRGMTMLTTNLNRHYVHWTDYLLSFESWLGKSPEDIKDVRDMNGRRFLNAIASVRTLYKDNKYRLVESITFVFAVFRQLASDYKDINFFSDSIVMDTGILSVMGVPTAIAKGYELVATGGKVDVPGGKAIFRIRNAEMTSANGTVREYRIMDASDIIIPEYRRLFLDFLAYHITASRKNFSEAKRFILRLQEMKLASGKTANICHLFKDEADLFIAETGMRCITANSYNSFIYTVKMFINFAVGGGYMTMDKDTMKGLRAITARTTSVPRAINGCEILAIDDAFRKLSNDPLVMLTGFIFHIQMLCRVRAGSLCAMKTTGLKFLENGCCLYTSIEKNSGRRPVTHFLGQRATDMVKDALDYTADIHARCPEGYGRNNLFIYETRRSSAVHPIIPMTTTVYTATLKKVCEIAGVKGITSGNVRDTYMTAVRRYARQNKLSAPMEMCLTGHRHRRTTNSYDDIDLAELLSTAADLDLGTVEDRDV